LIFTDVDDSCATPFQQKLDLLSPQAMHQHYGASGIPDSPVQPQELGRYEMLDLRQATQNGAGHLKHQQPSRSQNPYELVDVFLRVYRINMLQRNIGVDEVESIVAKQCKGGTVIQVILAPVTVTIVLRSQIDHRRCDVDAMDFLEVSGQRLAESPDAASKVKGLFLGKWQAQGNQYIPSTA
jgi:hypothetical protein